MSNYCSIGLDAKIGLAFDKNRTKSRLLNKVVYSWEGLKNFCLPQKGLKSVIEKMENITKFEKRRVNSTHDLRKHLSMNISPERKEIRKISLFKNKGNSFNESKPFISPYHKSETVRRGPQILNTVKMKHWKIETNTIFETNK